MRAAAVVAAVGFLTIAAFQAALALGAPFVPDQIARWGPGPVILLPVGAAMNAASSSPWERFLWAPLALVLAVLCYFVARG